MQDDAIVYAAFDNERNPHDFNAARSCEFGADGNEALCAAAQTSQVGRFDVTAIELWALTEV